MEFIIVAVILLYIVMYRSSDENNIYKFIQNTAGGIYDKYAPYSYKVMRQKIKDLGLEFTTKDYLIQILVIGGLAAGIGYLYFYSIIVAIIYAVIAILFIPYLTYLRCKRQYSEFIFEQIQTYCTNTIMEFRVTNAFVKALEGVVDSGVLEDPVLSDVQTMISLSYENGTVDDSIIFMNAKYPYYMVKNMHQLFLQVTKEGAKDTEDTFDNMLNDIDVLVEGVYRDRLDRKTFHGQFVLFGVALYGIVILIQFLVSVESYIQMLDSILMQLLLHALVIINSLFILNGEKYYNENVGVE